MGSGDILETVVAAGRQECESDGAVKAIGRFGGKEVRWNASCSRVGSVVPPRGEGLEKARRIRLSALLLLVGKRQGNDQSTSEDREAQITAKREILIKMDQMNVFGLATAQVEKEE